MQWFAQAPSNIALIKYMGKKDVENNIPMNRSLSYTLSNLVTSVVLEQHSGKQDFWEPLAIPGKGSITLSVEAQNRYLRHLARLKATVGYTGAFIVRSNNNFPHSSGLASSASSFAALTKCALQALSELTRTELPDIQAQAQLSRLGSGSSCRSFFSPWALWNFDEVSAVDIPYNHLIHQVIVISHDEKKVPSTEAHLRIMSSPLYPTRAEQAEHHLKSLLHSLESSDWKSAQQICWREFQDLHHLFTTCSTPFSYFTSNGNAALNTLQEFWQREGDGPLITMDAGPNIHLLYRSDQEDMANKFKREYLVGNYDVL